MNREQMKRNNLYVFVTRYRKYILEQFAQEEETTFLQSFRQSIDTLQFQMQSFVQDAEYCTSWVVKLSAEYSTEWRV